MLKVYFYLLDDAFKPATPLWLTSGVINTTVWQFASLSDISKGSVATHLRCGGMFSDGIIANLLLILTVKQFRKSIDIAYDKLTAYEKLCKFLGPPCRLIDERRKYVHGKSMRRFTLDRLGDRASWTLMTQTTQQRSVRIITKQHQIIVSLSSFSTDAA